MNIPNIIDFKIQGKLLKQSGCFTKLNYAYNFLAKKYGFKDYNAYIAWIKKNDPK